jgi:hypothetical protein
MPLLAGQTSYCIPQQFGIGVAALLLFVSVLLSHHAVALGPLRTAVSCCGLSVCYLQAPDMQVCQLQ